MISFKSYNHLLWECPNINNNKKANKINGTKTKDTKN